MVTSPVTNTPTTTGSLNAAAASVNAAAGSTNAAANAASRTSLADNYSTFLTLLTSQLQNQDPMSPMDSTQFTQQLVQFSQVEQQIRTNEELNGLVSQYKAQSAGTALSYLGRDAIISSDNTVMSNGVANWAYNLGGASDTTTLEVRDSKGRTVYSGDGEKTAGNHLFAWDGKDNNGVAQPNGIYQLVVTAKNTNGDSVSETTTVRENIMGVDFTGDAPTVMTASGTRALSTIRAIIDGG
jgi:flagellar basal-body rod modification protein FlgD